MAFWSRLRQSQLKTLSNQIKKCHLQTYYTSNSLNHTALHTRIGIAINPNFAIQESLFEFPNNVRFFAAPVQAKQKKEEKDTSGPRLNEQITASVVRLVSDEGHTVVSRYEALERARRLKLDLVEVQRNAQPPVCKLMDYNKEKYKQQIKEKEKSKSKTDVKKGIVKEVRFSGQITQKDLQLKADTVKRLLEEGYRVKCMVTRKKDEDLEKLLSRFLTLIEDVSMVENGPRVEEQQAHLIVRHVKLGPSKKGSGKKAAKATDSASTSGQKAAAPSTGSTIQLGETFNASESYSENEDDAISADISDDDYDSEKKESNWTVSDSKDDFHGVFDVGDGVDGVIRSSNKEELATKQESLFSPPNRSMNPRSTVNLAATQRASTTSEAPVGTENRYRREPRNPSPPARPMNGYGPGAINSRLKPPFVDPGRQPQYNINGSHQKREAAQHEAESSRYGNSNFTANSFSKQNSSGSSSPSSTASSFGVFSASRTESTPEKQNVPTEVNRYKKGNASDPARNSRSTGFSADRNSPMSNYKSRGQGIDKDVQGKFGIFSQKSSNV